MNAEIAIALARALIEGVQAGAAVFGRKAEELLAQLEEKPEKVSEELKDQLEELDV